MISVIIPVYSLTDEMNDMADNASPTYIKLFQCLIHFILPFE